MVELRYIRTAVEVGTTWMRPPKVDRVTQQAYNTTKDLSGIIYVEQPLETLYINKVMEVEQK